MPPLSPAARALLGQGHLLLQQWRPAEALEVLERAAALDAADPLLATTLATARAEMGDTEGARRACASALERHPDDPRLAAGALLVLPQVYTGVEDVPRWRARFLEGISALEAGMERFLPKAGLALEIERTNFLLAYQGEDDREPQRRYGAFLARLTRQAAPRWAEARPARPSAGRRLRVGFAGAHFYECTAGRYFERWVTGLDPRRFERAVFYTGWVQDALTQRIASGSERFVPLRVGALEAAESIAAADLDVLVYPEVGMDPLVSVLASLRLAPVQCAAWGHPVTTGCDAIDYYLSCAAMEPEGAQAHYVEPLVTLQGIGVDYARPGVAPARRADFGLPEGRHLYFCPQSLFKIHPENDRLLARIAAADAEAVLVFFQAMAPAVTQAFARRLQDAFCASGVAPRGQIKFLPRLAPGDFRRALATADVMVDTVRWSGGNTSLDALACGVPIVTLPGRFMRARQSAAMLRTLGLGELVAGSPEAYVDLAIDLARDRARNARLRALIGERSGALFGRAEAVEEFSEKLLAMAARAA
jgi:CRISPR-associated protein Csy1